MSGTYLLPTQPPTPVTGDALADALQALVVGVTGLPGDLVRPRWQPTPPAQPSVGTDWCAVGVTTDDALDYPYQQPPPQDGVPGTGTLTLTRWESLEVLVSFYGPSCDALAKQLRDGLYVATNLEQLACSGLKLTGTGQLAHVPEQVNLQWVDRTDLPVTLAAAVTRDYAVPTLTSAETSVTYNP